MRWLLAAASLALGRAGFAVLSLAPSSSIPGESIAGDAAAASPLTTNSCSRESGLELGTWSMAARYGCGSFTPFAPTE